MSSNSFSLKGTLMPIFTSVLTSDKTLATRRYLHELNRSRKGLPHQITFYHKVDDPYSHLLLQLLQKLMGDFDIKVKPRLVSNLSAEMFPEPEMLEKWSLRDCERLAQVFDLDFPKKPSTPPKALCKRAEKILLSNEKSDSFLRFAIDVNHALWVDGEKAIAKLEREIGHVSDEQRSHVLESNEKHLLKKGHYLSATLSYGGEWYWGPDRIYHLAERLMRLDIFKTDVDLQSYHYPLREQLSIKTPNTNTPLDLYFSFRSPYSYLALSRSIDLCEKYKINLNIKPVLPMVTRGLPVPNSKKLYIFSDCKREANRYKLSFGKVVDPLGKGVENSLALFEYAKQEGKENELTLLLAKATWAEGKDLSNPDVLEELVSQADLSWLDAKAALKTDNWQTWAESNRQDLFNLGFWGVPSFQYGEESYWGQDRLWAIEQTLMLKNDANKQDIN